MLTPRAKRVQVTVLMMERHFGVTRARGPIQLSQSLYRYRSILPPYSGLRERIGEIAALNRHYGYRRVHWPLRREGWRVNRKHVYWTYQEAGLAVRRRRHSRIEYGIPANAVEVASNDSTAKDRPDAMVDTEQLAERIGCLTAEIRQLEVDRVNYERGLENYRAMQAPII